MGKLLYLIFNIHSGGGEKERERDEKEREMRKESENALVLVFRKFYKLHYHVT